MATWRGRTTALKLTIPQFRAYFASLRFDGNFRASGMTLHNTASPSRKRWDAYPGEQWLRNLKSYYISKGWPAGPHLFIDGNHIWVMTDLNVKGTHSPSWNGTRIGVEMVADFATEDDDSGIGLKVKQMTAHAFAIVHQRMGWEPSNTSIKLHKEDPATTHDCPGRDINKSEFIQLVLELMGEGGEHPPDWDRVADDPTPAPEPQRRGRVVVPAGDHLKLRAASSAASAELAKLPARAELAIKSEAKNGSTLWYAVDVTAMPSPAALPAGRTSGWVAARYVELIK